MKKGISLIVLVITIIVMIILAAAVVISMSNTGIIDRADVATKATNEKQVQDLAALAWAECYIDNYRGDRLKEEVLTKIAAQGVEVSKYNISITDTGIEVKPNVGKVTNLAGTTWKFKEYISGYDDVFGVFNYEEQSGYERYPNGTKVLTELGEYNISSLALTIIQDNVLLSTVGSVEYFLDYIPENNLGAQKGWYAVTEEDTFKFLTGNYTSVEELLDMLIPIQTPTIKFSDETNSALMNTKLIAWLYENATRIK